MIENGTAMIVEAACSAACGWVSPTPALNRMANQEKRLKFGSQQSSVCSVSHGVIVLLNRSHSSCFSLT